MELEEDINKSVELLKKGKILLHPTNTIWGIGCDASNSKAVNRINKLKKRKNKDGLIVIVNSFEMLTNYVKVMPPNAREILEASTSPLTIIFPKGKNVAKNVLGKDGSIAIRIVNGKYSGQVINRFGKAIVSTSANISNEPTAVTFDDIDDEIKAGVDYVVQHYRTTLHSVKASTIIYLDEEGLLHHKRS